MLLLPLLIILGHSKAKHPLCCVCCGCAALRAELLWGALERWQGDAFLQDISLVLTYDYNQTYPIALWEDTSLGGSWALYPEKGFTTKTITRC